jgi:predicted transcriptional regulator
MSKINVTFRTDDEKLRELDALALMADRDRSYLLNEAIDGYLELRRWQLDEIAKGLAEADAGEFASDEEVKAAFERWTRAD